MARTAFERDLLKIMPLTEYEDKEIFVEGVKLGGIMKAKVTDFYIMYTFQNIPHLINKTIKSMGKRSAYEALKRAAQKTLAKNELERDKLKKPISPGAQLHINKEVELIILCRNNISKLDLIGKDVLSNYPPKILEAIARERGFKDFDSLVAKHKALYQNTVGK